MNNWSDEIEEICERVRLNCVTLSEYHRKRYYYYKGYSKYFTIPLIIMASLNSTASVGLQPYLPQPTISGITCLLGMAIGIMGSIELYFGVESSQELEFKQSKDFYTLAIDLYKMLNIKRENRETSGRDYLNEQYSKYIKMCEASSLLVRRMKPDLLTEARDGISEVSSEDSSQSGESPHSRDFTANRFRINKGVDGFKLEDDFVKKLQAIHSP